VLSVVSGTPQTAPVNSAFALPLVVGVVANAGGEPVDGGRVTYTAPGAGASATFASPATIVGGQASVSASANGVPGSYSVTAGAAGASGTPSFALTNGTIVTTTSIASVLPATTVVGEPYTVTVDVTSGVGAVGSGNVEVRQLSDGSVCTIDLSSASSCQLVATRAITTAVRANYLGAGVFAPSQSGVTTHGVTRASTTVTIVEDAPDPSAVLQPVTVRLTLGVVAPGAGTPTGEILVTDGIASCSATLPNLSCELIPKALGAATLEARYLGDADFNPSTDTEPHTITAEGADLAIIKRNGLRLIPGGQPSTNEDALEELAEADELPRKILEYRSLAKLKGTYTDKLPELINPASGRVHTSFHQAVAATGRLSSSDPNLQNIPIRTAEGRRIRSAFIAPPGQVLVSADYSQIELRIMAHLSRDERLLEAFARGEDVHRATAAEIFGITPLEVAPEQRRAAKAINFGLIYGMSAFGLAKQINVDRSAAQAYMDRYFARYPGVARYMEETRSQAREHGYVETVFGRRLWLPEIRSSNVGRRQGAERAAINAPMQGTAADLIKRAMLAVQGWLDDRQLATKLILQVHDELVLEVPDAELPAVRGELPRLMGGVAQLAVPLLVDVGVGGNWDEAH